MSGETHRDISNEPTRFGVPDDAEIPQGFDDTETDPSIPNVEMKRLIGRGGMGTVYEGTQTYLGRRVAVKVLPIEKATLDVSMTERFRREARALAELSHPNIVACHDAGVLNSGVGYLVMEFVDGPNLKEYLSKEEPLEATAAVEILRKLASALKHALERGVIHRDVKPENVLLQPISSPGVSFPWEAKLADLGLARFSRGQGDMTLTREGVAIGTPSVMAPEQFEDTASVDHRADIYSLGCVLFHMLTGKNAYRGKSISEILKKKLADEIPDLAVELPSVSPDLNQLYRRLVARDPKNRPQTYDKLIEACDAILTGGVSGSGSVTKPLAQEPDGGRAAFPLAGIGLLMLLVLAGGVFLMTRGSREHSAAENQIAAVATSRSVPEFRASPTPAAEPTPQVTPTPSPSPTPRATIRFTGETLPLFNEAEFLNRIDTTVWERKSGSWGPDDDGPGVVGVSGVMIHERDPGPMRLECRMDATLVEGEASVGFMLENGEVVCLRTQHLGSSILVSLAHLSAGADAEERSVIAVGEMAMDKPDTEEVVVEVVMEAANGEVKVWMNDEPKPDMLQIGSDSVGVELAVSQGYASFSNVTLTLPES